MLSLVLMALTFFLPLWRIEIFAPQYPEGLLMQIGLSKITGSVDQINILNHYIGMKKIHAASIPELRFMPVVMGVLIGLGALAAALNRRWLAGLWSCVLVAAATAGFVDFYLWGYDYGHNLSEDAPIKVPGMSYQPPLIGHKMLLNIHSYSLPDTGGIALAVAISLAVLAVFWRKRPLRGFGKVGAAGLLLMAWLGGASGCTAKPEPIRLGVDSCDNCHMQITDARFGGEIITKKGRIHKFDSIPCLTEFLATRSETAQAVLVSDYLKGGQLTEVVQAKFLRSEKIKGPMGSGLVASADSAGLADLRSKVSGEILGWKQINTGAPARSHP